MIVFTVIVITASAGYYGLIEFYIQERGEAQDHFILTKSAVVP